MLRRNNQGLFKPFGQPQRIPFGYFFENNGLLQVVQVFLTPKGKRYKGMLGERYQGNPWPSGRGGYIITSVSPIGYKAQGLKGPGTQAAGDKEARERATYGAADGFPDGRRRNEPATPAVESGQEGGSQGHQPAFRAVSGPSLQRRGLEQRHFLIFVRPCPLSQVPCPNPEAGRQKTGLTKARDQETRTPIPPDQAEKIQQEGLPAPIRPSPY